VPTEKEELCGVCTPREDRDTFRADSSQIPCMCSAQIGDRVRVDTRETLLLVKYLAWVEDAIGIKGLLYLPHERQTS
jgi:hypothetical protein